MEEGWSRWLRRVVVSFLRGLGFRFWPRLRAAEVDDEAAAARASNPHTAAKSRDPRDASAAPTRPPQDVFEDAEENHTTNRETTTTTKASSPEAPPKRRLSHESAFERTLVQEAAMRVVVLEHMAAPSDLASLAGCNAKLAVLAAQSLRSSHCFQLVRAIASSKVVAEPARKFHAIARYFHDGRAYEYAREVLHSTGPARAVRSVVHALVGSHPPSTVAAYDVVDCYFDGVAAAVDEASSNLAGVRDFAINAYLGIAADVDRPLDERCLAVATIVDFSGYCLYDQFERRFLRDALDELKDMWNQRFLRDLLRHLDDDDDHRLLFSESRSDEDDVLSSADSSELGESDFFDDDGDDLVVTDDDVPPPPSFVASSSPPQVTEEKEHVGTASEKADDEDEEDDDECFDAAFDVRPEDDVFCTTATALTFASFCRTRVFIRVGAMLTRIEENKRRPKRKPSQLSFISQNPSTVVSTASPNKSKTLARPTPLNDPPPPPPPPSRESSQASPRNPVADVEDEAADKVLSLVAQVRGSIDRVFTASDAQRSFVLSRHAELVRLYQLHVVGSDARAGLARIVRLVSRDVPRFAAMFFLLVDRVATRRKRDLDHLDRNARRRDDGYMLRTYVALFHVCELCLHTSPRRILRQLKDSSSVSSFLVGYKAVLEVLPKLFRQANFYTCLLAALDRRAAVGASDDDEKSSSGTPYAAQDRKTLEDVSAAVAAKEEEDTFKNRRPADQDDSSPGMRSTKKLGLKPALSSSSLSSLGGLDESVEAPSPRLRPTRSSSSLASMGAGFDSDHTPFLEGSPSTLSSAVYRAVDDAPPAGRGADLPQAADDDYYHPIKPHREVLEKLLNSLPPAPLTAPLEPLPTPVEPGTIPYQVDLPAFTKEGADFLGS